MRGMRRFAWMAAAAICAAVPSLAAEGQASLRSCGMRSVCGLSGISARDSLRTSVPADRRFLPTSRRIDRGINDICYAYKGEMAIGFAASYGTLTSDDTDLMLILDGIDMKGSVFTLNPSFGYFIKDNIWFHDAPAGAFRNTFAFFDILCIIKFPAVHTIISVNAAMQFIHSLTSCQLMQTVYILRNDSRKFSRPFQFCQFQVSRIRLCIKNHHFFFIKFIKCFRIPHKKRMTYNLFR